jgi:hypothetical protein
MKSKFLGMIACVAMLGIVPANAASLDFTFSFTNNEGSVNGTVTGEVDGLVAGLADQTPTALYIDSYPSGLDLGLSTPISVPLVGDAVDEWTVTNTGVLSFIAFVYAPSGGAYNLMCTVRGIPICLTASSRSLV